MNRLLSPLLTAVAFAFVASIAQAALEKDLGGGLAYFRSTNLTADQAAFEAALAKPALVLDLRHTLADVDVVAKFRTVLQQKTDAHTVRFILISPSTAPALVAATATGQPGILTLGPRSPACSPDIAVSISTEDDRHAYDALASGTPLEKLLNDTPEKTRYDESTLVHDRANGTATRAEDGDSEDAETAPASAGKPVAKKATPPLIDAVLLRAVQLHRALVALKKI